MRNAKEELIYTLRNKPKPKCAYIYQNTYCDDDVKSVLKIGYNEEDFDKFLEQLNFEYDSGFGGQELYGTVWLEDGTWLSRGEYDGSEWWDHNFSPEINEECK